MCYPSKILSKNIKRVEGRWMPLEMSLSFLSPIFKSVLFMYVALPFLLSLTLSLALIKQRYKPRQCSKKHIYHFAHKSI